MADLQLPSSDKSATAHNSRDSAINVTVQIRSEAGPMHCSNIRPSTPSDKIKFAILGLPGIWMALIPFKLFKVSTLFMWPQIARFTRLTYLSREVCNYSYHHTDASTCRLAALLACHIDGTPLNTVLQYYGEITFNPELQAIYQAARAKDKVLCNLTDPEMCAGRQLLYYCLARRLKPRLVFEAGTAHGIGSLLLLHALKLNALENQPGRLITVDVSPNAGRLLRNLPPDYEVLLEPWRGDSEVKLDDTPPAIDLFFHDTADIAVHEARHYELLQKKLSASGVICTTWGASGQLAEYSMKHGRRYFEFTTQAQNHWCNDTLGISLPSTCARQSKSRL